MALDGGAASPATVEVGDDALSIVANGSPIMLPFVDIDALVDDDYTLRLTDYTGRRYDLSMFGKAYGQIAADVRNRRDEKLQHDLLLTGVSLQDKYPAKQFGGPQPEPVELRVFQDLLVVVPEHGTMWGLPFSFIEDVAWDQELYQVHVKTDDGADYVFGQLAKRSEEFRDELKRVLAALERRTAQTLAALLPGVSPSDLSALAGVMRDGRAVQQRVVDQVAPGLWPRLEDAVVGAELREPYEALKAQSPPGWTALGVKSVWKPGEGGGAGGAGASDGGRSAAVEALDKGVAPEEVPPEVQDAERPDAILWFFCPLSRDGKPVNAVAHEITSESGHATYLYRCVEASRWGSLRDDEVADAVWAGVTKINRAILTLNFRREPIFAPEQEINEGHFTRYKVALRKLDYLRFTRENFLGRAIHNATWQQQVDAAVAQS